MPPSRPSSRPPTLRRASRASRASRANSALQPLPQAVAVLIAAGLVAAVFIVAFQPGGTARAANLQTFSSEDELAAFLERNGAGSFSYGGFGFGGGFALADRAVAVADGAAAEGGQGAGGGPSGPGAIDHSSTNVQVAGVDEADIVKNDGRYIYALSGDRVVIVEAYPPSDARAVAEIAPPGGRPTGLYLAGDRLVVIGRLNVGLPVPLGGAGGGDGGASDGDVPEDVVIGEETVRPVEPGPSEPTLPSSYVRIYDVSDPADPALVRDVEVHGFYQDSRLIGDQLYAVLLAPAGMVDGRPVVPTFAPGQTGFPEIHYVDTYDRGYQYVNVLSVDVQDDAAEAQSEAFLLGRTTEMYVSPGHLYLVQPTYLHPEEAFDRWIDDAVLPGAPAGLAADLQGIRDGDGDLWDRRRAAFQALVGHAGEPPRDVDLSFVGGGGIAVAEARAVPAPADSAGSGGAEGSQESPGPDGDGAASSAGSAGSGDGLSGPSDPAFWYALEDRTEALAEDLAREWEKSLVHKLSLDAGAVDHVATGEVPGRPLNQFSMDEHEGHFRIATTTSWLGRTANHVYVLEPGMEVVGSVEDLAPGERIFSARFMGDRGYLVTFVQIDPLFVLDLSDPTDPRVLGELKIPGVSEYLHPVGDDHLLGIGREGTATGRLTGLKVALFDVSDPKDPREVAGATVGGPGSWSEALNDHKAVLYRPSDGLLVLPVSLVEAPDGSGPELWYGPTWQGAYVWTVTPEGGIVEQGRITHAEADPSSGEPTDEVHAFLDDRVRRSLTMDEFLYTVSDGMVKANALDDLSERATVRLR